MAYDGVDRIGQVLAGIRADAERHGQPVSVHSICRTASIHLGCSGVAVMLPVHLIPGAVAPLTIGTYGPEAEALGDLQITTGQGPSVECLAGLEQVIVKDLDDPALAARWPLFAASTGGFGIRSIHAIPMRVGGAQFGVFSTYLTQAGGLPLGQRQDAVVFASVTLDLLLYQMGGGVAWGQDPAVQAAALPAALERLASVLDDHPAIHHATGMIAIQLGVSLPTALVHLRARAFSEGRALHDLAADVVARRVRFGAAS